MTFFDEQVKPHNLPTHLLISPGLIILLRKKLRSCSSGLTVLVRQSESTGPDGVMRHAYLADPVLCHRYVEWFLRQGAMPEIAASTEGLQRERRVSMV